MSTSTHIIAFRDMDGEFARMLEVKRFCVNIDSALTEWRSDEAEGREIEIAKLPPEVKTIRFYQSW